MVRNGNKKLFENDQFLDREPGEDESSNPRLKKSHSHEITDPDDPLYGVPDDLLDQNSDPFDVSSNAIDDNEFRPNASSRAQLVPKRGDESTQFFGQTSAFGVENYAIPDGFSEIDNDVSIDALDRPNDITQVDNDEFESQEVDKFDVPMADDGLLSREATVSGIAAIEKAIGAPEIDSIVTASAVAEAIANATTYPITPPALKPDLEKFESVARKLSHILSVAADEED